MQKSLTVNCLQLVFTSDYFQLRTVNLFLRVLPTAVRTLLHVRGLAYKYKTDSTSTWITAFNTGSDWAGLNRTGQQWPHQESSGLHQRQTSAYAALRHATFVHAQRVRCTVSSHV